ncbi:aldo/keto reductase, partial [Escherichia coli]|nr:aldo/keto reductase [Escherichia coli]
MQYHRIPHSSLEVSTLGLGTMTFGEQNSEADAHAQLDYAVAQGINLIDVAEMYPVPPRPETQGDAPRDKCTLSCAINGIHAAFHYLKK